MIDYTEFFEQLNRLDEDLLLEMANLRGRNVKVPKPLPFSFYFSTKTGVPHNIRVKPIFNPDKMSIAKAGTQKLCDGWEYIPGPDDKDVSNQKIREMQNFFKKYLVLFCMVWEEQLQEDFVQDYFRGLMSFSNMLKNIDFYSDEMSHIKTIEELEQYCRDNNLVNFHGNS